VSEPPPIERAFFREAEDGTVVFFPWGLTHRGYELPDAAAKKKASRAASVLLVSPIAVGTWAAHTLQPLLQSAGSEPVDFLRALAAPGAVLLFFLLSYWLWVSRFVERFAESDLQVSREERLREAAGVAKPREVAFVGVAMCGLSSLLIWLEPRGWWLGALGVAIGLGALFWSSLLRRASRDGPV
jgi:hypothetical protein